MLKETDKLPCTVSDFDFRASYCQIGEGYIEAYSFLAHRHLTMTGLQHLKDVSGYKLGTYKSAKTLWHYIFAEWRRLGQFAQRGGCGDSGRP